MPHHYITVKFIPTSCMLTQLGGLPIYQPEKNQQTAKTCNQNSAYVKIHDGQIKWMYFLIEDDDLLEKYDTIWDKGNLIVSLSIIKMF